MSSGRRRARSSTSSPSEIRVWGWICSRRASRGSWLAASLLSSRTVRTVRRALPSIERATPVPTAAASSSP